MGTRREGRILALQVLYAYDAGQTLSELLKFEWAEQKNKLPDEESRLFAQFLVQGVLENLVSIDNIIEESLINKELARVSKVDLTILRLSAYGILYQKDIPYQIIINEAIDLSKDFSTDNSFKLINGVLDAIVRKQ